MSPDPFLPSGTDALPARRFVLLADSSNVVRVIDESRLDRAGDSVNAFWDSPCLNAEGQDREFTLKQVWLAYSAKSDSSITLRGSRDGGVTWEEAITATVESDIGIKRVQAVFNVTGFDLRFRVIFPEDELVVIHEYRAKLIPRSEHIIGP